LVAWFYSPKINELESDKWNTTQDSIKFCLGEERVAIIRAIDNSLDASVAGFEAPMRVRKITLIDYMDWLFLDFEESCELHRLALSMRCIPYAALNSDLLSLLVGLATPYFRQHRSANPLILVPKLLINRRQGALHQRPRRRRL
jgi:hypothetical protein